MQKFHMFKSNKADVAIGTLIIFIAMIIVAAIAAGVIIQTATALQNKALLTGEKAKQQVGTGISTILIYGEDGEDKTLESFFIKMKLSPGSDPLKFKDMLLEVDTKNSSIDAVYGERLRHLEPNVSTALDNYIVDFNDDNLVDYVRLYNSSDGNFDSLQFNLSNGSVTNYMTTTVSLSFKDSSITSLETASSSNPIEIINFNSDISVAGTKYGTVSVIGKTTSNQSLTEQVLLVVGSGNALEQGSYAVDYLLKGANWKNGYLQRGDIVKMALVAPNEIGEDEEIDVRIVPKAGSPRTVSIVVPDLVNNRRVYMFS